MSERLVPADAYIVEYGCEEFECDGSVVRSGGYVYATNPPGYPSVCQKCGVTYVLNDSYPMTQFKRRADG